MARAYGSNSTLIGAFESAYGTAPADGFFKLPFVSSTLGSEQPLVEDDTLGNGRDPSAPSRDGITVDGELVVPLDVRNVGHWLKGLLGSPTTTGSGPYVHSFTSGAASLPSLALEIGNPEVPSFRLSTGAVVNSLKLPFATSGNVAATVNVIAQKETPAGTTKDGTPTAHPFTRFSVFQGAVKKDGAALGNVTGAELTYTNNLDPVRVIRDDGLIEAADPTMAALTGTLTVRFADTSLLTAATAGTPIALEFGYRIDAARSLVLTVPAVHLPRPRIAVNGPGGVEASFNWQAARPDGDGPMLTVVLTNDVATY